MIVHACFGGRKRTNYVSLFINRRDEYGRIKPARCPICTAFIIKGTVLFPNRGASINNMREVFHNLSESLNGLNVFLFESVPRNELNEMVKNLIPNFPGATEDENTNNAKKGFLDMFVNLGINMNGLSHEFDVLDKSCQHLKDEIKMKNVELNEWKLEAKRMTSTISKLKKKDNNKNKMLMKLMKRLKRKKQMK